MTARLVAGPTGAEIMAEAVKAAEEVFKRHGMERAAVVVNVVWKDADAQYGMGSKIPSRYRAMMRESLLMSGEEAE
jgi:hypothetical protein